MLDFKELPENGNAFELLIREIAFTEGFAVYWSGAGPDGGRDLLCRQSVKSILGDFQKTWLIQCKHFAHSGRAVGTNDILNVTDICRHHGADGYVVATSTHPSSGLVQRLEALTARAEDKITTSVWDSVFIERILSSAGNWAIAQRFFPISAAAAEWQVSATTSPNRWVINISGHNLQLENRIGSHYKYHFDSIRNRIEDLEKIKLSSGHFFRVRAVWYDDKNGGYRYYIDYMVPTGQKPRYSKHKIAEALGDGHALEDGQVYSFDVIIRSYNDASDHYDPDHYEYYVPFIGSFLTGGRRFDRDELWHFDDENVLQQDGRIFTAVKDRVFDRFQELLVADGFKLIRATNAQPEALEIFSSKFDISSFAERQGVSLANALTAEFFFAVSNEKRFYEFVTLLPQDVEISISVFRKRIYLPAEDGRRSKPTDDEIFVIQVTANDFCFSSLGDIREGFNKFYLDSIKNIEDSKNGYTLRPNAKR